MRNQSGSDLLDCYKILDLHPNVSCEELKQAYRDLVAIWHPDRFVDNPRLQKKVEEKLKEINAAYDLIKSSRTGDTNFSVEEKEEAQETPATNDKSSRESVVDYSLLKNFLKSSNWERADIETKNIILRISNRDGVGWLTNEDVAKIPPSILRDIDALWFEESDGNFGFRVQKKIWDVLKRKINSQKILSIPERTQLEWAFGAYVRWYINNSWLFPLDEFNYSTLTPMGKLPRAYIFALNGYWSYSKGWTGYLMWEFDQIFCKL